ncbi:hypothetical protein Tco_0963114 [Tanacetum coccineum]
MSAMANTTPIVTTVMKTTNKEKTQKEMDKVNIQDVCEEHYDDILPIIMDKVDRQALGILPALEVAPPVKTVPDTETPSVTLKSHMMVSTPPNGLGPRIEDPLEIYINPGARGDGWKANLHHPADLKAAPVIQAIGSQEIKGARR